MEALETAALKIASAIEAAEMVALRLRQLLRRVPGLRELIESGIEQVSQMARDLGVAHAELCAVLAERARERHDKDPGVR